MKEYAISDLFSKISGEGRDFLYEHEVNDLFSHYGAPIARTIFVIMQDEVLLAAETIGYPDVLKVVSPQILHKSDVGGVLLDLNNSEDVRAGYTGIVKRICSERPGAEIVDMIVKEMAPSSTEIIIGATRDPQFGPTVMFGIGGILTEIVVKAGNERTMNVVLLGTLAATGKLPYDGAFLRKAVKARVPPRTIDAHMKAFGSSVELFRFLLQKKDERVVS